MIEGFETVNITEFDGLFANGPPENIPKGHLRTAQNVRYITGGVETRFGTTLSIAIANGVRRWFPYKIEGQVNRILYLDTGGRIYDSLYPATPILTITAMIDFSMVVFNERAYISPHDRKRGLSGQVVYIYQGGGNPARPAAGQRPLGFTLSVATGNQGGKIEPGTHLFAVAYETDSGFITGPGPEVFAQYAAPGGTSAKLTNLPIGPTGTIARHILATQAIQNYNGDQLGQELFFIEGAEIDDNALTELEVDFYDSELVRSADYLHDEMSSIPAVLGLGSYQGSLIGWGVPGDESTLWVSKANEPESINLTSGGLEVDPSEAGGIRNAAEVRGLLLMAKSGRFYSTHNTGEEPSTWGWVSVDRGIGTEIFGIASILDDEGSTVDRALVASKPGLMLYTGTFENLSIKIQDVWDRITKTAFDTVQATLDPEGYIYVAVPLDGANSPNTIIFGDFRRRLDPANIRWSLWTFPYSPTTVGIDTDALGKAVFKIGSINGNLYFFDPAATNDNGVAIPNPTIETHMVGDEEWAVSQFGGVRLRASGTGILDLQIRGLDDAIILGPPSLPLVSSPGRYIQREFDVQSPFASVKFSQDLVNEKFKITRITIYHAKLWMEEPESA